MRLDVPEMSPLWNPYLVLTIFRFPHYVTHYEIYIQQFFWSILSATISTSSFRLGRIFTCRVNPRLLKAFDMGIIRTASCWDLFNWKGHQVNCRQYVFRSRRAKRAEGGCDVETSPRKKEGPQLSELERASVCTHTENSELFWRQLWGENPFNLFDRVNMSYLGSHLNKSKILLLTRLHVACEIWTLAKAQRITIYLKIQWVIISTLFTIHLAC